MVEFKDFIVMEKPFQSVCEPLYAHHHKWEELNESEKERERVKRTEKRGKGRERKVREEEREKQKKREKKTAFRLLLHKRFHII